MRLEFKKGVAISGICILTMFLLAAASWAGTGCLRPYVDTGFNSMSPDDDPALIVVREHYDEGTHQQSLYFRNFDNTRYEGDAVSGVILLSPGIEISEFISVRESMEPSDFLWGIRGADYSGRARGLENRVPDWVAWKDDHVEFYLTIKGGIDEFRVIVDYGDTLPAEAYIDIVLSEGINNEGIPYLNRVEVGNIDGAIPGSGDYDGVTNLRIPLIESAPVAAPYERPLPLAVDIKPKVLNLNKKDFKAVIQLADGYSVKDIDQETLNCEGIPAKKVKLKGDKLMVNFPVSNFGFIAGGSIGLFISGNLSDGTPFEGYDIVKIKVAKKKVKAKKKKVKRGKKR